MPEGYRDTFETIAPRRGKKHPSADISQKNDTFDANVYCFLPAIFHFRTQ